MVNNAIESVVFSHTCMSVNTWISKDLFGTNVHVCVYTCSK